MMVPGGSWEITEDVFPSEVSTYSEMNKISRGYFSDNAHRAQAFVLFQHLNDDRVSYYSEGQDNKDLYYERLCRLLKNSQTLDLRARKKNILWFKLAEKFKKLPLHQRKLEDAKYFISSSPKDRKEHADTRQGFKCDSMLAVKKYFTFGERKTNEDEVHIVQTSEASLRYYELTDEYKSFFDASWQIREGRFNPAYQKYFREFDLEPFSAYYIPQNTIYVLISVQQTLFSFNRVSCETFAIMKNHDKSKWRHVAFLNPNIHERQATEADPVSTNIEWDANSGRIADGITTNGGAAAGI